MGYGVKEGKMGNYSEGKKMYELAGELFPVCRSITGEGTRMTLKRIQQEIPQMTINEVPSGSKVFEMNGRLRMLISKMRVVAKF